MPFTTEYLDDIDAVAITYSGRMLLDDGDAAIAATGELVAAHDCHRFLADCSGLEVTTSLFDVMAFVERLLSQGMLMIEREAIVQPRDSISADRIAFLETACRNRGLNVRVFRDRHDALAWLAE